jgi:hypothetical protein
MNTITKWFHRIIRSRTMLFNILVAAFAAMEPVFGLLQAFVPGHVYAYLTVILTVGNAILRAITTTSLSDK